MITTQKNGRNWTIVSEHIRWDILAKREKHIQKVMNCETDTLEEGNGYYSILVPTAFCHRADKLR